MPGPGEVWTYRSAWLTALRVADEFRTWANTGKASNHKRAAGRPEYVWGTRGQPLACTRY